jgi:ubiquinone/menaquinone biosynthesis C-methylase UbiE
MKNIDNKTVDGFGDEWSRFDQAEMSKEELKKIFEEYFLIFPWGDLPANAEGFDMGCGSGRWASLVLTMVGRLHCIDPSSAINVARRNLSSFNNVSFHKNSAGEVILPKDSQDFGYSLGVLHHVPDTEKAIKACVSMLKPGAPLLLYLYYRFENRSFFYKFIWIISDVFRRIIYRLPYKIKHIVTNVIAATVYFPLAKLSSVFYRAGFNVTNFPLSYYRGHSFYTMKTDSRDRFGTPLEKRFTRAEIKKMMENSGLKNIKFSENAPYWCAVGVKL